MKGNDCCSKQISGFRAFLEQEEYRPQTISKYVGHVIKFLKWLHQQSLAEGTEETVTFYFNDSSNKDFKSNRAAINQYYRYCTGKKLSIKKNFKPVNSYVTKELNSYDQYLDEIYGLTEATRRGHLRDIERFLCFIKEHNVEISTITLSLVQHYLSAEISHLKPVSKNAFISRLRSFIRYQTFVGCKVDPNIFALQLSAPVYKLSKVPQTFEREELDKISAAYDVSKVTGIRDYAIFRCFTELGLRASEVAGLTLDDFNWHEGTVKIRRTKSHRERIMPLPNSCGQAIYEYIKKARPDSTNRSIFLRFAHQRGQAMGREQIRGTVRRAYARAGITTTITGTHILRHSKAKDMYECGSSLKVIADVLGHESIDTTVIYTKVASSQLQCVTCPWIGASHE
jgi:site-specific recombinase XerD